LHIKGLAMPIYAYRCDACGHAKDVLQKISDPVLTTCPACGAGEFRKQLTAAGFQLKGSGWYATDFKGGSGGAKPAEANKAAEGGDAKPAEPKTAKPDSTPSGGAAPAAGCGGGCACH
jgi:putative FmdB family regulatory protein